MLKIITAIILALTFSQLAGCASFSRNGKADAWHSEYWSSGRSGAGFPMAITLGRRSAGGYENPALAFSCKPGAGFEVSVSPGEYFPDGPVKVIVLLDDVSKHPSESEIFRTEANAVNYRGRTFVYLTDDPEAAWLLLKGMGIYSHFSVSFSPEHAPASVHTFSMHGQPAALEAVRRRCAGDSR